VQRLPAASNASHVEYYGCWECDDAWSVARKNSYGLYAVVVDKNRILNVSASTSSFCKFKSAATAYLRNSGNLNKTSQGRSYS
jgi:hypothetical protein